MSAGSHPIRVAVTDDLRRSRLTVFFRLLLALPHLVWLSLWGLLAALAALATWTATLVAGRSPEALHRFLSAFLRYQLHVLAYLFLVANPFPGFLGKPGSYPVDAEIDPPQRQNRWVTGFRIILVIPALVIESALNNVLEAIAVLGWLAALATGRMPQGMRNLGAFVLRYHTQTYGYLLALTDRYPNSGP